MLLRNCAVVQDVVEERRRTELAKSRHITRNIRRSPETSASSASQLLPPNTSPSIDKIFGVLSREHEAMLPPGIVLSQTVIQLCPFRYIKLLFSKNSLISAILQIRHQLRPPQSTRDVCAPILKQRPLRYCPAQSR